MSFHLEVSGLSDVGRTRTRNEDAFDVEPEVGLVVVADGMGGCPAGDVASRMAVEALVDHFKSARQSSTSVGAELPEEEARVFMEDGVKRANVRILRYARDHPEREGMGTTLTAFQVDPGSGDFVVGHVGDSRIYRLREGELAQLTRDHTWVQTQVEKGSITQEAARLHPYGHILSQALGVDPELKIEVHSGRVAEGDLYVLCTDGLTTVLSDGDLLARLASGDGKDLDQIARDLVEAANEGGAPDNVTVGLIRIRDQG